MNNTPDSPAKPPDDRTDQGGNYWTLFTPGIWKVLHAVLHPARPAPCARSGRQPGTVDGVSVSGVVDRSLPIAGNQVQLRMAVLRFHSRAGFDRGARFAAIRRAL